MSTNKLLQTLSEDPQLEKQIGCMAGILQLFDRHQVLTGRRLYGHKRIATSATSNPSSTCGSPENGSNHLNLRLVEDAHKQAADPLSASRTNSSFDKKVLSTPPPSIKDKECREHPRAPLDVKLGSVPSPRKLDSSRSLHEGRVFHEGKVIARKSVDTADRARVALLHKGSPVIPMDSDGATWSPLEIRDVGNPYQKQLPAKIVPWRKDGTKETSKTVAGQVSNAPWLPSTAREMPTPCPESNNRKDAVSSDVIPGPRGKDLSKLSSRNQVDLNESLRLLAKLREAPWNFVEGRDVPKHSLAELKEAGTRFCFSKEGPRNSYDGREPPRASSVEYKELKSAHKIKDTPRLSLDGRLASSDNGKVMDKAAGKFERKLATLNSKSTTSNCDYEALLHEEKRSSPNVVARLMGLEEMPTIPSCVGNQSRLESHKRIFDGKVQPKIPLSKSMVNQSLSTCDRRSHPGNYGFTKSEQEYAGACDHWGDTNVTYSGDKTGKDIYAHAANAKVTQQANTEPDYSLASIFRDQPTATRSWMDDKSYLSQDQPDVLASVSNVSIPIEEMQSLDPCYKDIERRLRVLGLQNSTQDMQALKRLLESLQAMDHSLTPPRIENQQQSRSRTQHTSVKHDCLVYRLDSPQQDLGSLEWRSKQLHYEQEAAMPTCDRKPSAYDNRAPAKIYRQRGVGFHTDQAIDACNSQFARPVARFGKSRCPSSEGSPQSTGSRDSDASPRKAGMARKVNRPRSANGFNVETASVRRIEKNSPRLSKCAASTTRSSGSHQSNPSSSGMSISSGRGQSSIAKSNAQKQMKKSESGKKNHVSGCVVKDREESRANLVSLKSQSRISVAGCTKNSSQADRRLQNLKARSISNAAAAIHKAPAGRSGASKLEIAEPTQLSDRTVASALPSKMSERFPELNGEGTLPAEALCPTAVVRDQHRSASVPGCMFEGSVYSLGINERHEINPTSITAGRLVRSGVSEVGEPCWGTQQRIHTTLRAVTNSQADKELRDGRTTGIGLHRSEQQNEDTDCQAEKLTGNPEQQPSPVSVLDSSFYQEDQEDRSPVASAKCALKFEDLHVGGYDAQIRFRWDACVPASTGEGDDSGEEGNVVGANEIGNDFIFPDVEGEKRQTDDDVNAEEEEEEEEEEEAAAQEYVREVLAAAALTGVGAKTSLAEFSPVAAEVFDELEGRRKKGGSMQWRRKWLFDRVNGIVKARLREWVVAQEQPWVARSLHCCPAAQAWSNALQLPHVWAEIAKPQPDEDLELHVREWGDHVDMVVEKGQLAMHVERLIFKDLIDHTLQDLLLHSSHVSCHDP